MKPYSICKNRRNCGDSPEILSSIELSTGNPATLVVGGSDTRERFRRFVCDCVEKRSLKRCELGAGVVVI